MLKKILLSVSIVSIIIVGGSFASVNNTMTTKGYVDTEIEKKQLRIPAAGTAGVGAGETVVTYTATAGEIGERELFTGGTYNAANDSNKLITASALKSAFTLPETQTTKLTCANPGTCDLWTITNQTAYGRAAFNPDVSENGTSQCYRALNGFYNNAGTCGADTLSYLGNKSGKWGVVFPYGDISGISVCSAVSATDTGAVATDAQNATLNSEYAAQAGVGQSAVATNQTYCWCKMENPAASPWVYSGSNDRKHNGSGCASGCASSCSSYAASAVAMRRGLFGIGQ